MTTLNDLTDHPEYQRILADSFGGVMYNTANQDKYNSTELLTIWNALTPSEQHNANGIIQGAMHFIQGDN